MTTNPASTGAPEGHKKASGLLAIMRDQCAAKTSFGERYLRNHKIEEANVQLLASAIAYLNPQMSFNDFIGNLLQNAFTAQDRRAFQGASEEALEVVMESLFRAPFGARKAPRED